MDDMPFNSQAAIMEMRRRHLTTALKMQGVAAAALRRLEEKAAQGGLDLTVDEAKKLMAGGLALERDSQPAQRRPLCPPAKRTRKGQPQ